MLCDFAVLRPGYAVTGAIPPWLTLRNHGRPASTQDVLRDDTIGAEDDGGKNGLASVSPYAL